MKNLLAKLHSLPKGVKASVAYFIASVITSGIGYLSTPIYTRLLPSDVVGQASVYMTWVNIFGVLATFRLYYGVFNNGMLDYKDNRDGFSLSMLKLSNLITLGFAVVFFIAYPFLRKYINMDIPLALLMIIEFLTQPANLFWSGRQRYEYKYKKVVFFSILIALCTPIITVLSILIFNNHKLHARLFGAIMAAVAFYIGFYIYIYIKGRGKCDRKTMLEHWKYAFFFNLPLIPHYLSTYLLGNSDKIMIQNITGDSDAAYYSIAHNVAAIVLIVWSAANSSLIPFTYEKCKEKDYKSISNVSLSILTLFGVACVLIILLAPEVIMIMSTSEYRSAMYVVPPIVGGVFFQVHYYLYANILYYFKKPKYVMYSSVIATFSNIVLNYIFISKFGYIAAGYTTIFCYLLQATIDYFALRHVVKEKVYNMKYVGALSLALVLISIFSNLTYNFVIIRYVAVAAIFALAIVFRKKIMSIFSSMKKKA